MGENAEGWWVSAWTEASERGEMKEQEDKRVEEGGKERGEESEENEETPTPKRATMSPAFVSSMSCISSECIRISRPTFTFLPVRIL